MMHYDLVFYPDYRKANPYQRLMYDQMSQLHPRSGTIDDAIGLLDRASPEQRVVFHLHWEDSAYRHLGDPAAARTATQSLLAKLEDFTSRGGTLIWTVHNHGSHIQAHPELDRSFRMAVAELADIVHVHSMAGAAMARSVLNVASAKLVVLPHGNYLPVHSADCVDRTRERQQRGYSDDDTVILLFGRLDEYKGGSDLLTAFQDADPRMHLVIAGKQLALIPAALERLTAESRSRVRVEDGFVPEPDVGALFVAADAVVLPYRSILTSGTLMLALTLGVPVIAPDLPAITHVVEDGREGIIYRHDQPDGLAEALIQFTGLDEPARLAMRAMARQTGALYDWKWIGRQMKAAIIDATDHGRSHRKPSTVSVF